MKKGKETIIVLSAHSDDFVIGAGGAIAQYVKEGKKVISIVFSYGEKSHPWLKESVVQKMRSKEAFEASKLLGCEVEFFDLREFKFMEDYKTKKLEKRLYNLIIKHKPTKIFTHSNEDPHPDHQSVHKITLELYDKLTGMNQTDKTKSSEEKKSNKKSKKPGYPELYIYSIWNPVSFQTQYPSLYVNITKTFSVKLASLRTFRSQHFHVAYPFFLLLYRAFKNGLKIRTWFAEQFFRIK